MNSTNRRWLRAATATVGAAALTFGGAVLPAAAADSSNDNAPAEVVTLSAQKYQIAATTMGSSVEYIKAQEKAGKLLISANGAVRHVDVAPPAAELRGLGLPVAKDGAAIPGSPETGSRPGAKVTIFLDFDGAVLQDTQWNIEEGKDSLTLKSAAFATAAVQASIWAQVAEDYAPFDVNVTTKDPGEAKLVKSSKSDTEFGSHVIITDSYDDVISDATGTGGLAYRGGLGSAFLEGALVFTQGTGNGVKATAEAATHEAGHNFGLSHDSHEDSTSGYYGPEGGLWSPIMGTAYTTPISQFSNGSYGGATNKEDDLSLMTDASKALFGLAGFYRINGDYYAGAYCDANGGEAEVGDKFYMPNAANQCTGTGEALDPIWIFGGRAQYAQDQVGNNGSVATVLDNADGTFETADIIEKTADRDVFKVLTNGGTVEATVAVADIAPNLNAKLTLSNSKGDVVVENAGNPQVVSESQASGLGATVTANNLPAGTYYLIVEGVGFGNPSTATLANANGFSDYGSLGNYTLTGKAAAYEAPIVPVDITTPADGATVDASGKVTVSGVATPGATVTLTVDGETVGTASVDEDGKWTAKIDLAYGESTIVATQTVKGEAQDVTDSVTVKAPVAAPSVTAPANGSTTEDTTPSVSGVGIAGATVTVTIVDADGNETVREVKVGADGTWTLALDTELALGDYTVTAKQVIDGITSSNSKSVSFTIEAADDGNGDGDGDGNGDGNGNGDDDGNGDDNGNGNGDDDLATTGSDFNAGIFALLGGAVLAIGGGTLLFARRSAKQQS